MLRRSAAVVAVVCALACVAAATYSQEALNDEIVDLPNAPKVNFRQFSGYIDLPSTPGRKLFYWFVESQSNPSTDPLFIWTNGGPGCSGLIGKMTENGPFYPTKDGASLELRKTSWNKIANIIFFEQPAGVGYSISENARFPFNDTVAANDNLEFIREWYKRFSNYKQHDFYLSSESYGGHYLPTLALNIVKNAPEINFKGFLVGNPFTYGPYRDYGEYAQYGVRQITPRSMWTTYRDKCQPSPNAPWPNPAPPFSAECQRIMTEMSHLTKGMDPYAVDFPSCTKEAVGRGERALFMNRVKEARLYREGKLGADANEDLLLGASPRSFADIVGDYFPQPYEPCQEDYAVSYLRREDVMKALHAQRPRDQWNFCSNIVYSRKDWDAPMQLVYKELHERSWGRLNVLIFSGDDDAVCSTIDAQLAIWTMGFKNTKAWTQWKHEGQVAGMVTQFDALTFATVHGAGHMVPSTRPDQALQLLKNFLSKSW